MLCIFNSRDEQHFYLAFDKKTYLVRCNCSHSYQNCLPSELAVRTQLELSREYRLGRLSCTWAIGQPWHMQLPSLHAVNQEEYL